MRFPEIVGGFCEQAVDYVSILHRFYLFSLISMKVLKAHGLRPLDLEPKEVNFPLLFDVFARGEEQLKHFASSLSHTIFIIVISLHFHHISYVTVFILN